MSKCDVWICLGRGNYCLTLAEPDDDKALAALVNEELDVRGVIRARLRFAVLGVVPSGLCFEQALVCRVVEALVTNAAHVECEARLVVALAGVNRGGW